jgi:phosphoribosylanthranilate isomerase
MWVKICGNTRLDDCRIAADAGADAVGFVFAAGKRTVTAPQVAQIVSKLPPELEKIGVFTSRDPRHIVQTAKEAGLTGVQLHGPLDRVLLEAVVQSGFLGKIIQVLHWRTDLAADAQRDGFASQVSAVNDWKSVAGVLVDSQTVSASGGTGTSFDWKAVAPLVAHSCPPVIVAGGLTPEKVIDAVAAMQPWGVDVSSGVEDAPGVKNPDRIRAFLRDARST